MKKNVVLFLVYFVLLSYSTTVYSKGKFDDFDAFETYFGKNKAEVKIINPNVIEKSNTTWLTDYKYFDDEKLCSDSTWF